MVKEKTVGGVGRLVASQADAIVAASDAIAEEARALQPKGKVVTIANGCDFDDFAGLEHHPSDRLRITHTGNFHGKRDPKPFFRALAESGLEDVVVRFAGDVRAADREYAEALGLGDRLEFLGYVSRRRSLELQRDSEALLLLIPNSGGREKGVLTGKIFEYLAAERPILAVVPPDGAAADLIREVGTGVVAAPEDVGAIREALAGLHERWRAGSLNGAPLPEDVRDRLDRRSRVREYADLLLNLGTTA
jgi:glycosyltransferase involved in cell wall biosynthesis